MGTRTVYCWTVVHNKNAYLSPGNLASSTMGNGNALGEEQNLVMK
jgi:hypothetical protein